MLETGDTSSMVSIRIEYAYTKIKKLKYYNYIILNSEYISKWTQLQHIFIEFLTIARTHLTVDLYLTMLANRLVRRQNFVLKDVGPRGDRVAFLTFLCRNIIIIVLPNLLIKKFYFTCSVIFLLFNLECFV